MTELQRNRFLSVLHAIDDGMSDLFRNAFEIAKSADYMLKNESKWTGDQDIEKKWADMVVKSLSLAFGLKELAALFSFCPHKKEWAALGMFEINERMQATLKSKSNARIGKKQKAAARKSPPDDGSEATIIVTSDERADTIVECLEDDLDCFLALCRKRAFLELIEDHPECGILVNRVKGRRKAS